MDEKAANEGDEDAKNWLEEFGNITEFISGAEAGDAQAQAELASKLDVFVQLDEYEEELENEGVLTDVESYDEEYPRVRFKAEAGDARAIELLARLSELNDNE